MDILLDNSVDNCLVNFLKNGLPHHWKVKYHPESTSEITGKRNFAFGWKPAVLFLFNLKSCWVFLNIIKINGPS